jgi:hypothetical protein
MTTKNVEAIHRGGFAHPSSCERRRITNAENLIRLFVIRWAAVGSLAWRREVAPLKAGDEATRDNQVTLARRDVADRPAHMTPKKHTKQFGPPALFIRPRRMKYYRGCVALGAIRF